MYKLYFVTKIVLTSVRKKCLRDSEKLLQLEAEGQEFEQILRSLEQLFQTVKGQNNIGKQNPFLTCSIHIGKIIGFRNMQEKLENVFLATDVIFIQQSILKLVQFFCGFCLVFSISSLQLCLSFRWKHKVCAQCFYYK